MDATLKTVIGGALVELPGTIAGIRAGLDKSQAAQFEAEVEHTAADELPAVLARWALKGTSADDEDDAVFARLAAGDFTGCQSAEDEARPGAA